MSSYSELRRTVSGKREGMREWHSQGIMEAAILALLTPVGRSQGHIPYPINGCAHRPRRLWVLLNHIPTKKVKTARCRSCSSSLHLS